MTTLCLFSREQGWLEVRSQNIPALWVCYVIPGFAESLARAELQDLGPHSSQLWDTGIASALGWMLIVISVWFIAYLAGKVLLCEAVVLGLLFLGKQHAAYPPDPGYFPHL